MRVHVFFLCVASFWVPVPLRLSDGQCHSKCGLCVGCVPCSDVLQASAARGYLSKGTSEQQAVAVLCHNALKQMRTWCASDWNVLIVCGYPKLPAPFAARDVHVCAFVWWPTHLADSYCLYHIMSSCTML